jgi:hypothetical protein
MYSAMNDAALPAPGFPIRRSAGQRLFSASPRLIAAVHVLHRLLVPRHPSRALSILTVSSTAPAGTVGSKLTRFWPLCSFQASPGRHRAEDFRPRSLKTEQRTRRPDHEGRPHRGHVRSTLGLLPRKEVIQPQLPLRLPCYDFTPITSPTFDGCLPKG